MGLFYYMHASMDYYCQLRLSQTNEYQTCLFVTFMSFLKYSVYSVQDCGIELKRQNPQFFASLGDDWYYVCS